MKVRNILSILLLVAVLATACAPAATEVPAATNVPAAGATDKPADVATEACRCGRSSGCRWLDIPTEDVTIEIWWHEYGPFTAYMEEMIPNYMEMHPNITVNVTKVSSADLNQKLSAAIATGTGPDILDQDASYYVQYYEKGVLEPLNLDVWGVDSYDDIINTYLPGGADARVFDGKIYTLPYQGNSIVSGSAISFLKLLVWIR